MDVVIVDIKHAIVSSKKVKDSLRQFSLHFFSMAYPQRIVFIIKEKNIYFYKTLSHDIGCHFTDQSRHP